MPLDSDNAASQLTTLRPRKSGIVRSKTGCKICRQRRKKCDEKKPQCGLCARLGQLCEPLKTEFEFREVAFFSPAASETLFCTPERGLWGDEVIGNSPPSSQDLVTTNDAWFTPSACLGAEEFQYSGVPSVITAQIGEPRSIFLEQQIDSTFSPVEGPQIGSQLVFESNEADPSYINPFLDIDDEIEGGLHEPHLGRTIASVSHSTTRDDTGLLLATSQDTSNNPIPLPSANPNEFLNVLIPREIQFQHGPNQVNFYMNLWDTKCLGTLHPTFQQFGILEKFHPAVFDITVALSACHLSRMLPQKKPLTKFVLPGLSYRPDMSHLAHSQQSYQSAIRRVGLWVQKDRGSDIHFILAVMVLFCILESSLGNFSGFAMHTKGVQDLVHICGDEIGNDERKAGLLAAWIQAQLLNWWRRLHFSTPAFHNTRLSISIPFNLEHRLHSPENRRVLVLLVLCESLNIVAMCLAKYRALQTDIDIPPAELTATVLENLYSDTAGVSEVCSLMNEHRSSLDQQSMKLDRWHAQVPLTERPIESFQVADLSQGAVRDDVLSIEPLFFTSHEAAMNYAYYVTARVFQCAGKSIASNFETDLSTDALDDEKESWIFILLRIASGIDWRKCVELNVHTIGISGLLFASALRSRKPLVGLWIQDWLEERQRSVGLEEGSFPVLQILQILRIINREQREGYEVLSVFQATDDEGGTGKFDSYHSQNIVALLIYEQCRDTGRIVSKHITV